MTEEEIKNMPAGKEMDALIAEKIMTHRGLDYGDFGIPPFSTDTCAAFEVVERVYKLIGYYCRIEVQTGTRVTFWSSRMTERGPYPVSAAAGHAALAICRAALLSVSSI